MTPETPTVGETPANLATISTPPQATPQPPPHPPMLPMQPPGPPPLGSQVRVTVDQLAKLPDSEARTRWIQAIVEADTARTNYATDMALAREFATCGEFNDIRGETMAQSIAKAMVKIQLGRAWGFNSSDSMRSIYFVNGRPAVENEIVAAKLQQAGYAWDIEWIERTEEHKGLPWARCIGCRLWLRVWSNEHQKYVPMVDRTNTQISVAFTEADADHAIIYEKGQKKPLSQKENFQSWSRDMYYWRTIGRVKKYHAPHVLRGGLAIDDARELPPAVGSQVIEQEPPVIATPQPEPAPVAGRKKRLRDRIIEEGNPVFPTGCPACGSEEISITNEGTVCMACGVVTP